MVWGISPELPGTGLGALTYAMRHVAQRRSTGRRERHGCRRRSLRGVRAPRWRRCAPTARSTRSSATATPCVGVALADGTEITAPVVVSACDPHRTFVEWLRDPPAGARRRRRALASASPSPTATSRRSTPSSHRAPRSAATATHRSASTLDRRAQLDRRDGPGHRADARRAGAPRRPALLVNVPSIARSDDGARRRRSTCSASRCCYTPYRLRGGWPASTEPRRWLELFADRCEPGFLDSIVDWRAMTPDVYEREFHLPAGHAASFAGGPLAALRNPQPGAHPLRDRRARVSTSPARRRSPAPASGARAGATAPPSCSTRPCPAGRTGDGTDARSDRSTSAGSPASRSDLHWSVALIALLLGGGLAQRARVRSAAAVGVVAFLGSILGHELAHALVARRFGVGTPSIELWALGGMARLDRESPTPRAEGWIAAAGPAGQHRHRRHVARRRVRSRSAGDAPDRRRHRARLAGLRQRRPRAVQPAARRPARRRAHRPGGALGAARRPLPGDARGRRSAGRVLGWAIAGPGCG